VDTGVGGDMSDDLLPLSEWEGMLDGGARRALKRQRCTRGAGRLVVSVMQIDPTPFGVGYRTGFVLGERERRARQTCLTDECQHNRD
jgi:hypothetical protein